VPEGDTLHRTASGLAPHLVGRVVTAARVQMGTAQVQRVVGATITSVDAVGKNLLIRFDNDLEIRTHLQMRGSWHRYRPGERWRRPPARARLVLEVPGAVAVCFDAPVVELFETRAEAVHPSLAPLGPDLLDRAWGPRHADQAQRRLRDPGRAGLTISEALLDQRAVAGLGNIWRNETLFHERIDPWTAVGDVDDPTLGRIVATARRLLLLGETLGGGRVPMSVYRRTGRPCPRCGTSIRSAPLAAHLPRMTYWCPSCQPGTEEDDGLDRRPLRR
jgi:endonuclease-8